AVAERELGVRDGPVVAGHDEMARETEGLAQPVDHAGSILVPHRGDDGRLHFEPPLLGSPATTAGAGSFRSSIAFAQPRVLEKRPRRPVTSRALPAAWSRPSSRPRLTGRRPWHAARPAAGRAGAATARCRAGGAPRRLGRGWAQSSGRCRLR